VSSLSQTVLVSASRAIKSLFNLHVSYSAMFVYNNIYIGVRGRGSEEGGSCSKILDDKKIFQYSEIFQGNSVFQGKRKLAKNPE